MSLTEIIAKYFNTETTIKRRSLVSDDIGGLTETWSNITTDLPTTIQAMTTKEINDLSQGKEFFATFKMYCPNNVVVIKNGDRVYDEETTKEFEVVGVEDRKAARSDIATGHHYKLYLNIPKEDKT